MFLEFQSGHEVLPLVCWNPAGNDAVETHFSLTAFGGGGGWVQSGF